MRCLIMIVCLLTPSFGFAHMTTYNQEFEAHHMSSGAYNWGAAILQSAPAGGMWNFQHNVSIDPNKWYFLLSGNVNPWNRNNGENFLDNPLDTSLQHDIKLTDQNDCWSSLKYLGYIYNASSENIRDGNDGVYTLVYTFFYNKDPIIYLSYDQTYDSITSEKIYGSSPKCVGKLS